MKCLLLLFFITVPCHAFDDHALDKLTKSGDHNFTGQNNFVCNVGINTTAPFYCFVVSSNVLLGGGATFYVDAATGRVGIGTTNPFYKLEVSSDIYSGNEITSAGNMGVGGSAVSLAGADRVLRINAPTRYAFLELVGKRIGANGEFASISPYNTSSEPAGYLSWLRSGADNTIDFTITTRNGGENVNAVIFKADGKVGIGVASPSNKLSVAGNANFSGSVGIGMTNPSYRLHSSSDINTDTQLCIQGDCRNSWRILESSEAANIIDIASVTEIEVISSTITLRALPTEISCGICLHDVTAQVKTFELQIYEDGIDVTLGVGGETTVGGGGHDHVEVALVRTPTAGQHVYSCRIKSSSAVGSQEAHYRILTVDQGP